MTKHAIARTVNLALLIAASIFLMPLEQKLIGFGILAVGLLSLIFASRSYAKHAVLIYLSIIILGITPINTDISIGHMLLMGLTLFCAVGIPYFVTRYVYKEELITYPMGKHTWTQGHIGYILLAALLSYLILPFWMQTTGGHLNWTVPLDFMGISMLFIGTNALGIWDELFFIVTVLALLRHHLPFWQANLVQAALFTAFLYELGFRGWAPLLIYPFALLQGIVFKKTHNLLYIIAIHLTIDLVLFLALINAHHPDVLNIFITR